MQVDFSDSTDAMEWNANTAGGPTCAGVITGLEYTFGYSDYGEHSKPQRKINSAKAEQKQGTLQHSGAGKQKFVFSTSVSFVRVTNGLLDGERATPSQPVPIYLPKDLLYPFS